MDEQGKAEIRKEFTSRFWRLAIGIPVISGFLLWFWLSESKHSYFLWLTVLPLIFLVPLLRYHRAIRSLTEPGPADSTGGSVPVAVNPDEIEKKNIRRSASWVHWIVQGLLLLLITVGVLMRMDGHFMQTMFSDLQLSQVSGTVISEFTRFYFGRGRQLIAFPPPNDPQQLGAWADQIEKELGEPVAVFVRNGQTITWASREDSLEPGIALVPHLFESGLTHDEEGARDTLGTMVVRRISNLPPKGSGMKVWIVSEIGSDRQWGVVLGFMGTWKAFFDQLRLAEKETPRQDSPAWTLRETVNLGKNGGNTHPSFRMLVNGVVWYASPELDTTRHMYKVDSPPYRWEYYQSGLGERYAEFIGKSPVKWYQFIAWALLMGSLFRMQLWIRKLTKVKKG